MRRFVQSMRMRAVRVLEFGGEDKLKVLSDVAIPKPSDNEVLLQVKAAGINPVDTYIRQGIFDKTQVPYTPGRDGAGIVEEVGSNVKNFKKGDRVLAVFSTSGTYAEYCTANTMHVCKLDDLLSFTQGAAIGIPYYTAHAAVFNKAKTQPGHTVLVHGASGAVGIAAVQILKAHGCKVIGTAGTPEGMKLVKEEGADYVFNHREEGYMKTIYNEVTGGQGVNAVIEMLSNVNLQHDMEIIGNRGHIVIIGCRGPVEINPRLIMRTEASITGMALFNTQDDEWKPMHDSMEAGQKKGWLKPKVSKVYKLDDVSKGHYDVINKTATTGKLVIDTTL